MISLFTYTANDTIQMTLLLTSVAVAISSAEMLYNNKIYAAGGLLYWESIRPIRKIYTATPLLSKMFNKLFCYPATLALNGIRLLLAAGLIACILLRSVDPPILVLLLCLTGLAIHLRNMYSNNGSDQLANLILVAAAISFLPSDNGLVRDLSILFIACQSLLSYLTSGFLKLIMPDWRNGVNLKNILNTSTFGDPLLKKLFDRWPSSYKFAGLTLVFFEILLGLSFLFPPPVCAILLLGGLVLHGLIAITMGLNNFFWTYAATYPCIFFMAVKLH